MRIRWSKVVSNLAGRIGAAIVNRLGRERTRAMLVSPSYRQIALMEAFAGVASRKWTYREFPRNYLA